MVSGSVSPGYRLRFGLYAKSSRESLTSNGTVSDWIAAYVPVIPALAKSTVRMASPNSGLLMVEWCQVGTPQHPLRRFFDV